MRDDLLVDRDSLREFGAIPIAIAILGWGGLLLLAALAGWQAWVLLGIATVGAALILVWIYARRHRHPPLENAPATGHRLAAVPGPGVYRVLVVADETCASEALGNRLRDHAAGRDTEAFVVAPALGSRLARWTDDESAHADATHRLEAAVQALQRGGVRATGHVGSHDPLQAADEGLREFHADEVLFVTGAEAEANWLEEGVVDSARSRYAVPVTHIVVSRN
jgi:cell division protein FtsW (lipid II flippase)